MLTTAPPPLVSTMARAASLVEREGGGDVEVEGALEEPLAGVERRPRHRPARVVHRDVEPSELLDRRLDEVLERLLLGDVGGHHERPPARRADPVGDLLEVRFGSRRQHDIGARLRQADRDAATDAETGARDDGDLIVDPEPVEDHRAPRRAPRWGAARPATSGISR